MEDTPLLRQALVDRAAVEAFVTRLDAAFGRPGDLYLVGEATAVVEGWQRWADALAFTAAVAPGDRQAFAHAVDAVRATLTLDVLEESPGDVIPLPDGHAARRRPVRPAPPGLALRHLRLYHFDPYSTAFRYLARGDEPDYRLVLAFLQHGWVTVPEMDARLAGLLPRFTCETIRQDPAEFRRKYKGLLQMWRARRPDPPPPPTAA